jgi:hypothetical protein
MLEGATVAMLETVQTGTCTLRQYLYIMGLSESKKHKQQGESSYNIFCQWPAIGRHKIDVFKLSTVRADICQGASVRMVLTL